MDYKVADVNRTLLSAQIVLHASVKKAETMADQRLANDLWEVIYAMERITAGINVRENRYKPR